MRRILARCGLLAGLLACAAAVSARAGEIRGIELSTGPTGTRAEIRLHGTGGYKTLSLSGPDRLVVDFPEADAPRGLQLPKAAGVVSAVRTGQPVPGTLRVVFDLTAPIVALQPRIEPGTDGQRLVIEWPGDGPVRPTVASASAPAAAAPAESAPPDLSAAAQATAALAAGVQRQATAMAPTPERPAPAATAGPSPLEILNGAAPSAAVARAEPSAPDGVAASPAASADAQPSVSVPVAQAPVSAPPSPRPLPPAAMSAGMRPLIVAIDAGHGGQDPGAIGPSGKREKDVTLAMARELARQIDAAPGLKAYLVRDRDVFIPLHERTARARKAKADIFVSIHADAAENRSARGSSVYVLSLKGASSQRARWLADKENAADLVGGVRLAQTENTLASVLLDLAQSGHMKASEDAAHHVLGGLKRVGNNHKPNIERANFAVLRTADMPAMLVETAFISNPDEERRLIDPAFQRKVASAVLDGINTYFSRQPPPGTLFAARAQQAEAEAVASVDGAGSP